MLTRLLAEIRNRVEARRQYARLLVRLERINAEDIRRMGSDALTAGRVTLRG